MATWRVPLVAGSAARLAYGLGTVLAPEWMGGRLAPSLRGHPDPRMNLRGFGGAQSAIALYTLASATSEARARDALRLNALVDGMDTVVSLLEWRDRRRLDEMAAGGLAFNLAGLTCWALARAALRETEPPGRVGQSSARSSSTTAVTTATDTATATNHRNAAASDVSGLPRRRSSGA